MRFSTVADLILGYENGMRKGNKCLSKRKLRKGKVELKEQKNVNGRRVVKFFLFTRSSPLFKLEIKKKEGRVICESGNDG